MLFLYIVEMHPACFVFPMPLLLYGKLYSLNFLDYKFYLFSVAYIFFAYGIFLALYRRQLAYTKNCR